MRYYRAPSSSVYLALPLHSQAGLDRPRLGSIFGDIIGGAFGIAGGLISGDREAKALKTQRKIVEAQYRRDTDIARMQADLGNREIDAAVQTARIQAANELAAIDAAYSAHLSSQRVQKQVAEDALSAQLLAQTQEGIFGMSRESLAQSASLARTYPRVASATIVALALGTVVAVAWMRKGGSSSSSGRRKRRRSGWRKGWKRRGGYSPASSVPTFTSPSITGAAA